MHRTWLTAAALILAAAPALAQDPGDARIVVLGQDGPVVTEGVAVSPPEAADALAAEGNTGHISPVLRETDSMVLEPLVNRIGTDTLKTVEITPVDTGETPAEDGVAPGAHRVTVETEEDFALTADDQPVVRKRIVKVDRNGQKTITETLSAPLGVADEAESLPASASVRVMIRKEEDGQDELSIAATGETITETVTQDGTTRIIRIAPAGGQGATLITITKN